MDARLAKLALAGATLIALAAPAVAQQKINVTVCGASPGGLWSLLGTGIDNALKAAYPGSTATYQTSGGGFANVNLLKQKKCEIAIVHDAEITVAVEGRDPFKQPVKGMQAVALMYNWGVGHIFVTKEFADKYGVASVEDIAKKKAPIRVVTNKKGNINADMAIAAFEAVGATEKDIEKWGGQVLWYASAEAAELMKNRRADAVVNNLFIGHSSYRDIINSINVVLLPWSDTVNQHVVKKFKIGVWNIPHGAYPAEVQKSGFDAFSVGAGFVVDETADPQLVYAVAKALVEQLEKVRGVHKSMEDLTAKVMTSMTAIPYHPAAVKYYKEKGLM